MDESAGFTIAFAIRSLSRSLGFIHSLDLSAQIYDRSLDGLDLAIQTERVGGAVKKGKM